AARLHDHVLVETQKVAEREELLFGRVHRRVFALGRVREAARRPEHVAMRIDRARGRRKTRLRRIGMKRNVRRVQVFVHRAADFKRSSFLPMRGKTLRALPTKIFSLSAELKDDASM